ncbi:1-acyl-sn-glycerol-3-phosphate acyltransferase [Amphiplicatus metriothermophilus]|uniref:Putative hemolysin n=1 Tax=Amphiplicatus metriothermophilus TaxID=1519374 RepID=A0A239PK35_9PROT|nr:1-acyl-sn-glycerol-3-phosphate acyltransferase [Amphiplicatus metriothermophilus]MBB5517983.1 putative hemolysin [Amphiplicatus metriothermophilus]SNT67683.1 Putative hemolysin [Amphiplicatus metriothermophilus]
MAQADQSVGAPARDGDVSSGNDGDKHIVETLIEERATTLVRSRLWPLYRAILYPLLRKKEAARMADAIAPLSGRGVLGHVSGILSLDVAVSGLEHVPRRGGVIIASTHPTGIADGVAMYDALKQVRQDVIFFANRDAIRVAPRLAETLIPVEWVEAKRTRARSRETLESAMRAFESGACVVLFASGRIAYMDETRALQEQPWQPSVAIFARKYRCPVVPADVKARNSWLYYWFWKLSTELRDITLFNELLNKRGKRFDIAFGPAIPPEALKGDPHEVTAALREHAFRRIRAGLPWRPLPSCDSIAG